MGTCFWPPYGRRIPTIWYNTNSVHIDYLNQVGFIVDMSDSRVGKVDEVVSAGLLQQRDVLQVNLHALKHFGQILVVLLWNTHWKLTGYQVAPPMQSVNQIPLSDSYTGSWYLPQFCWGMSWCWTWSPAAEHGTDRCSHNTPYNADTIWSHTETTAVEMCIVCLIILFFYL